MTMNQRSSTPDYSSRQFLSDRSPWLSVVALRRPSGAFDIALVIDGTYSIGDESEAARFVDFFTDMLNEVRATDGIKPARRVLPKIISTQDFGS